MNRGVDMSLQKKILGAAVFKGMSDRRFPMFQLLSAANSITHQELTGELMTMDADGTSMPIRAPQQIAEQTQALNLTGQIQALTEAVNKTIEITKSLEGRIQSVESRKSKSV
tara:strand:- start:77 stop:412 length:336 start_codon:yes stop_codon:yes gene_type:complete